MLRPSQHDDLFSCLMQKAAKDRADRSRSVNEYLHGEMIARKDIKKPPAEAGGRVAVWISLSLEAVQYLYSAVQNRVKVCLALKAFAVDLGNIFGAGWPYAKPAVLGGDLEPAYLAPERC